MAKELSEIEQVGDHIEKGENFLLSGGAGSGKTYTLVKVIENIFQANPGAAVRCITYTNVAVNEIRSRLSYQNLQVSTIHDLLWECIRLYQKNLKARLIDLINENGIKHSFKEALPLNFFDGITIEYKEWTKLGEGIVSHDEIIKLAKEMFTKHPLLAKIIKDRFDFILIDEYQDTSPDVISILLDLLPSTNGKRCIIGLFGDAMQSIFPDGIGNIAKYVQEGRVKEVIKKDNRRNPTRVIGLANQLRTDTVTQQSADDKAAPNHGCVGEIRFLYSDDTAIETIKRHAFFHNWDFQNTTQTKELYLTHNLIATKAQFAALNEIYDKDRIIEYKQQIKKSLQGSNIKVEGMSFGQVMDVVDVKISRSQQEFFNAHPKLLQRARQYSWEVFEKIYLDKDQLIGAKRGGGEEQLKKGSQRDALISYLYGLQECLHLYNTGQYRALIKKIHFPVASIQAKRELKGIVERLNGMNDQSIEEVIQYAHESGIFFKTDKLLQFINEKTYVYDRVKILPFQQIVNLFNYVEEYTPYSTQHNVKGAEFENVLVVLDNGNWNNYNFQNLFLENGNPAVLERTRKLFYVCCTRAKKNLAVYYHSPHPEVIEKAKLLFGVENVVKI